MVTPGPQSFGKSERLNKSVDIRLVRYHGKRLNLGNLTVYVSPNKQEGPRLVIALTTRAGISVVRNRTRRRIREFFRKNKDKLGSYDFFFYAARDLSSLKADDFNNLFQRFFQWHQSRS